eukprot:GEMP01001177.1.p1 GENE.GEMP01001177.1~~GEMP01001177.1.p1  ORF type:complete len:1744 (-),score=342.01 GEMP01001177.1:85-5316(-)
MPRASEEDAPAADAPLSAPPSAGDPGKPEPNVVEGKENDGDADDIVWRTPHITSNEFKTLFDQFYSQSTASRGESQGAKLFWGRPRRWVAQVRSVVLRPATTKTQQEIRKENKQLFIVFFFGHDRREYAITDGWSAGTWVLGDSGQRIVTDSASFKEDVAVFDTDARIDVHMSYLELEQKKLRVEVWENNRLRINSSVSDAELPLAEVAKGSVHREMELGVVEDAFGNIKEIHKLSCFLMFEEVFDFELTFCDWVGYGIKNREQLNAELRAIDDKDVDAEDSDDDVLADGSRKKRIGWKHGKRLSISVPTESKDFANPISTFFGIGGKKKLSTKVVPMRNCQWGDLGKSRFRGTSSDLHNTVIHCEVWERVARGLGFRDSPLSFSDILLSDILDSGVCKAELLPSETSDQRIETHMLEREVSVGMLEGRIEILYRPSHRQSGDTQMGLLSNKRYIFVNVQKIDRIVTKDQTRPISRMGSYIEVQFDKVVRTTQVVQDTMSPVFNCLLGFELLGVVGKLTPRKLAALGGVVFRVFLEGEDTHDCVGMASVSLRDLLYDAKGCRHPAREKKEADGNTYVTNVANLELDVFPWWNMSKPQCRIFIETWSKPRLPDFSIDDLAKQLDEANRRRHIVELHRDFNNLLEDWNYITEMKSTKMGNFTVLWESASAVSETFFLSTFLSKLPSEKGSTLQSLFLMVGSIPFSAPEEGNGHILFSPPLVLHMRNGTAYDHAVLLCSYFYGAKELSACVCFGSRFVNGKRIPHAWVSTFTLEREVIFWDPLLLQKFTLEDRFIDFNWLENFNQGEISNKTKSDLKKNHRIFNPALHKHGLAAYKGAEVTCKIRRVGCLRGKMTVGYQCEEGCKRYVCTPCANTPNYAEIALPYATIDMVFNRCNVWANVRHPHPLGLYYDLGNPHHWYPFYPGNTSNTMLPWYTKRFSKPPRSVAWCEERANHCENQIQRHITEQRGMNNQITHWVKDSQFKSFLRTGLQHLHAKNLSDGKDLQYEEWKKLLHSKVGLSERFVNTTFTLSITTANDVAALIVDNVRQWLTYITESTWQVACVIKPWKNGITTCYVWVSVHQHLYTYEVSKVSSKPKLTWLERIGQVQKMVIQMQDNLLDLVKPKGATRREVLVMKKRAAMSQLPLTSGWHACGGNASFDGCEALYFGLDKAEAYGTCMANGRAPEFAGFGAFYEVGINALRANEHHDALAIGFSTDHTTDPDQTIDKMSQTLAIGFGHPTIRGHGLFYCHCHEPNWQQIFWNGTNLVEGDVVGLSFDSRSVVTLYVNQVARLKFNTEIPAEKPLIPVVDLLGHTDGVELIFRQHPPLKQPTMTCFIPEELVKTKNDSNMYIGNYPLKMTNQGVYFEVTLTDVSKEYFDDGITIGVCTCAPEELPADIRSIRDIPVSWAMGFVDSCWDGNLQLTFPFEWHMSTLRKGQNIGCWVQPAKGNMLLVLDGQVCAAGPDLIPVNSHMLYACITLQGTALRARFNPQAQPPEGDDIQLMKRHIQQVFGSEKAEDVDMVPKTSSLSPKQLSSPQSGASSPCVTVTPPSQAASTRAVNASLLSVPTESFYERPGGKSTSATRIRKSTLESTPAIIPPDTDTAAPSSVPSRKRKSSVIPRPSALTPDPDTAAPPSAPTRKRNNSAIYRPSMVAPDTAAAPAAAVEPIGLGSKVVPKAKRKKKKSKNRALLTDWDNFDIGDGAQLTADGHVKINKPRDDSGVPRAQLLPDGHVKIKRGNSDSFF